MNSVLAILRKDITETLRNKPFYFSLVILVFVLYSMASTMIINILNLGEKSGYAIDGLILAAQNRMDGMIVMACFMIMMILCIYVNSYAVMLEKIKKTMESLLCTPVSLRRIWLAKSLSVMIPSVVIGWVFIFGTIAVSNIFFITPSLGFTVLPGVLALMILLVCLPVLIFLVCLILSGLQFITTNPRIINLAIFMVIFGVGFGLTRFVNGQNAINWILYLILGFIVLLLIILAWLSGRVIAERIILTSRE